MGVSAASAVSTALNLFSILALPPSAQEFDKELANVNKHLHDLLPRLFANYDRTTIPAPRDGAPVEVQSFLLVDHIEELNEFQQTLTFHGTLLLMWRDARLAWDPEDFGQLGSLAFTGFDLTRFWWPAVTVKGVTMPSRQLAMFHNTIYTLKSTGHVVAELSISVKSACRINLHDYPNDNQTCFVFVFSPSYPSARVTFTATSSVVSRESMYGIGLGQNDKNPLNTTIAGGFELEGLDAQRFFAYAKGFTLNESEAEPFSSLTNTVLRYQIRLRRRIGAVYTATVSMPLFCTAVMAFLAVAVPNTRFSLLWLVSSAVFQNIHTQVACLLLIIVHNDRTAKSLPADFDSEPVCVRLSRILLLQFVLLIVFRTWLALRMDSLSQPAKGLTEGGETILPKFVSRVPYPRSVDSLRQLRSLVHWALVLETVLLFWWLFL